MGREVKRVPLDFSWPLDKSWPDHHYKEHVASCASCQARAQARKAGAEFYIENGYWPDAAAEDTCTVYNGAPETPAGEGWQLWTTVNDSPITPVFATAEELIDYMSQPVPLAEQPSYKRGEYPELPAGKGWRREVAEHFVRHQGWSASVVFENGVGMSGAEYAYKHNVVDKPS